MSDENKNLFPDFINPSDLEPATPSAMAEFDMILAVKAQEFAREAIVNGHLKTGKMGDILYQCHSTNGTRLDIANSKDDRLAVTFNHEVVISSGEEKEFYSILFMSHIKEDSETNSDAKGEVAQDSEEMDEDFGIKWRKNDSLPHLVDEEDEPMTENDLEGLVEGIDMFIATLEISEAGNDVLEAVRSALIYARELATGHVVDIGELTQLQTHAMDINDTHYKSVYATGDKKNSDAYVRTSYSYQGSEKDGQVLFGEERINLEFDNKNPQIGMPEKGSYICVRRQNHLEHEQNDSSRTFYGDEQVMQRTVRLPDSVLWDQIAAKSSAPYFKPDTKPPTNFQDRIDRALALHDQGIYDITNARLNYMRSIIDKF